jgi:hypothetical protein
MDQKEERAYLRGQRSAWRTLLSQCIQELGYGDDLVAAKARWITEREAAVAMLREVCGEHGDNDWPNDLHLADVIEKHLARYLERRGILNDFDPRPRLDGFDPTIFVDRLRIMDRPTCSECPFWEPFRTPAGLCHRYPPNMVPHDLTSKVRIAEFPEMQPSEWCGEHPDFPAYIASLKASRPSP